MNLFIRKKENFWLYDGKKKIFIKLLLAIMGHQLRFWQRYMKFEKDMIQKIKNKLLWMKAEPTSQIHVRIVDWKVRKLAFFLADFVKIPIKFALQWMLKVANYWVMKISGF